MRELELIKGAHKTRFWLDELPDWNYEVTQIVEQRLPANGTQLEYSRCAAVEMLRLSGPMAMYGALGATFVPEQREDLLIQVFLSNEDGPLFHDTIAVKSETAHLGFPKEYINGLLNGVLYSEYTRMLGTGTLSFCRAIHGEVGSSINFFEVLSRIVIGLLCLDTPTFSDQELSELQRSSMLAVLNRSKKTY